MTPAIAPPNHDPSARNLVARQQEVLAERLDYRRTDLELSLSDQHGRSARISLSLEDLHYERTYARSGQLLASRGDNDSAARRGTVQEILQQYGALEHESVSSSRFELVIEGDVSLAQDFFSAENTAQRIIDHASGLLRRAAPEIAERAMADISRGVAEGFAQAEAILGELPEIAQQTRCLVDQMLALLAERGQEGPRVTVADVLPQPEEELANEA